MKINSKRITILFILILFFTSMGFSFNSPPYGIKDVSASPDTSTNFLFNGKTYTFNLDDFYDDTNLYKQYTGANFSTEAFNGTSLEWTGVVNNDTVTPVNNTETQYGTPSGVYNGTYDFRDELGEIGTDIDFIDYYSTSADCYAKIIAEKFEHKKVLEISDDNPAGIVSFRHYYDEIQTNSTVEFWWAYDGTLSYQHYLYMRFREDATERVRLLFGYQQIGQIVSHNGTEYQSIVTGLPVNTFYHIKIIFDDSANTFDFYIDGENKGTFDYFSNSVVGLSRIYMDTRDTGDNYHHWFDAWGELWDPDYDVGENLYPDNINMIKGSYDYTDNMKVNDASYTTFTSEHSDGYFYESPTHWSDFNFTKGSAGVIGELETNNENYSRVDSGSSSGAESLLGTIKPADSDILTNWNNGGTAPHWSKLDEGVGGAPDGNYIKEESAGVHDKWNFDTLTVPTGHTVTKMVFYGYVKTDWYFDDIKLTASETIGSCAWVPGTSYAWKSATSGVLSMDQTGLDNFWLDVENLYAFPPGWGSYIETVYIEVYTTGPDVYSCDYEIAWNVTDVDFGSNDKIYYDYRTNVSIDCDLDIFNFETTTWVELESNTATTYITSSYSLTDPYINGTNFIKIRFQTATNTDDFVMELDQIVLGYWNISDRNIEMTITFPFAGYNEDLLAMTVQSWQRTNISQTINFSIWNYDIGSYEQISSSSDTSFTEKEFNTLSPSDFINSNGVVKLCWNGTNITNDYQLHIDYLFVKIYYKLDLVHTKSFDTNAIYRYRWVVLGSIYYTQWVVFEVVDPVANFHAISESDVSTRWILQNATLTSVEDFSDDISGSNWDLVGISNRYFDEVKELTTNYLLDNYSYETGPEYYFGDQENNPRDITWDGTYFYIVGTSVNRVYKYNADWTYTGSYYWVGGQDTTPVGLAWDGTYFYMVGDVNNRVFKYYANWTYTGASYNIGGQDISPRSIMWDGTNFYMVGTYGDRAYKYDSSWNYLSVSYYLGNQDNQPEGITWDGTNYWTVGYQYDKMYKYSSSWNFITDYYVGSRDAIPYGLVYNGSSYLMIGGQHNKAYDINIYYNISKNYLGSGYTYMQTNITQSISLQSTDYTTHYNLSSGDYLEVFFQTSSDSQISLILLKDGAVNKSLILSPFGNTNFNNQTVQISVNEFVEFDQLKISSTFEDTDNIKIYDIRTMKYTLVGDYADFYVGSHNQRDVYLNPDTYNLRIFEESTKKVDTNITISSDYYYVYTPIQTQYCRLALFNKEGTSLIFTDYHITINRSLNGEYYQFSLLDSIFYADEETYVYIDVYDRFDALIDTFERLASDHIDLELEVYRLQIKNLMLQKTTIDINTTHVYPLLSGDSLYFMLAKDYYQIGYYNPNDIYKQFLIYLDSNQAYQLNRSKICFLAYVNQKGEHLFFNDYKTYINGTLLYENVFYKEIGDDIGIEVKDLYDISIKNQTYTVVSGDNYIPVVLTMYSLKVMNQQEIFNHINITRDPNYYESPYYWSEWIAPNEIIKFNLFAGYYKINLTDNEGSSYSFYEYTLSGDDILLINSDNIISQVIYNIANVNTTIGNQITNVEINITNQNSEINNTIVNIEINLSNVNSTLGDLLVMQGIQITNIENNISSLYTFTNNSFINLNNAMNTSFIYMENNIYSINQSISTLVIGVDGKISIVNATINTMFTEMSNQFIVTQSTINYSFAFLNQTIIQIGNNITSNQIALQNLIIQRANDIDTSLINIQNLINLVNNTVADESLVIQTLVNLIGANITSNHIIINSLLNLIDNNITNNNIQLVSILDVIGNNITTNHFVIQTLIDLVGNNITNNHLELVTTLNLINNTMDQNQIELINRLLFINNSINEIALDLSNQLIFLNNTIYSAILDVSVSVDFATDNILGNISITYQQNDFLTELYKKTMFSQLLNWSDVAYNYTLMEDRIDVWEFINNYKNESVQVLLRYNNLIDNLTVSAQNTIDQFLPTEDVEYRLKSVETGEYLSEWEALPENRSVDFGFYSTEIPVNPIPLINSLNMLVWFAVFVVFILFIIIVLYMRFAKEKASIPIELKQYIKKKKGKKSTSKKNVFSDRDIYINR